MAVILFLNPVYITCFQKKNIKNKECVVTNFVYLLAFILTCTRGLARSLKSFYAFD